MDLSPLDMNEHYTSPVHALLSSPSSDGALREGPGFIQRSAERRAAFARARSGMHTPSSPLAECASFSSDGSLVCDALEQVSLPALPHSATLDVDNPFPKKKLEFQPIASNSPNMRRVSFCSTSVHSITPRSEKVGAIGLCVEQENSHVVVRSVNPDGPAAADGRIVPGDAVIAGVYSMP